ncbi:expansin-B15-like [Rosa rugosa]|uniref:expansin-B15-like n=1 Tax=Rosa rugosa TaxID=74645 RepID=UPI002B413FFE|nr:expansin-B15-like [Rosa rugosa]
MALVVPRSLPIYALVTLFLVLLNLNPSSCVNPKLLNVSRLQSDSNWEAALSTTRSYSEWAPAVATWYGDPEGGGTNGGACAYANDVYQPPFSKLVSAGGASLFKSGKGCGACYEVKCTGYAACSGNPVTVVITDNCPGGPCASNAVHFDLSGHAFGAMANSGEESQLRNAGVLHVQHRRVACVYPGVDITFRVDSGSNPYYLAVVVEYAAGPGALSAVELKQGQGDSVWLPMQQSWGAVWKFNSGSQLQGPLSIRIAADSGQTLVVNDVIPAGWQPGQIYRSVVNF